MPTHLLESNVANSLARTRGAFARVGNGGRVLVFYTGEELEPGTWLEVGRTGMTDNGFISRHAFELICPVLCETRAHPALPIDGKPAWYGQYRTSERCPWRTAMSDYGAIHYASVEAARAGAKVYAAQREARGAP